MIFSFCYQQLHYESRKRGEKYKAKGISDDQVAVILTQYRKLCIDLTIATMGRLKNVDIENAFGSTIKPNNK